MICPIYHWAKTNTGSLYTDEGSCDPVDWFVEHGLVCLSSFTVSDTFSISSRLHQKAHVFAEHAGAQAEPVKSSCSIIRFAVSETRIILYAKQNISWILHYSICANTSPYIALTGPRMCLSLWILIQGFKTKNMNPKKEQPTKIQLAWLNKYIQVISNVY